MTPDTTRSETPDGRIAHLKEMVASILNSPQSADVEPDLAHIAGLSAEKAARLRAAGFETVPAVADAEQAELAAVETIDETNAEYLQRAAHQTLDTYTTADSESSSDDSGMNPSMNEETVAEVASAADVSQAEARAVIEQMDADALSTDADEEEPPAAPDPALREYHADLIAPASLKLAPKSAQTSDVYTKTLYVEGYPQHASPRMFEELFTDVDNVDVDVSIHVGSHDRLDAIGQLRDAIEDLEIRVAEKTDNSDVTVRDSARRLEAHEEVYDVLSTGQDDAFDVGVYITLRGTEDDVEDQADTIRSTLKRNQITAKAADYAQQEGLVTTSPMATDRLARTTPMLGGAVGAMFPFSSTSLIEPSGVLLGYHDLTDAPIVMDRYERSNYNVVVVGEVGAGKSFNTKLNLLRMVARDPETIVIIIDPRGGFHDLVETLDGNRISVGGNSPINPLQIEAMPEHVRAEMDVDYDPFTQGRESAMDTFDSYFAMNGTAGESSYTERRSILSFALDVTYALYGITSDPATHTNPSPTIPDVRSVLGAINRTPEPFIQLTNAGIPVTPDVVADLPGLDPESHQVTATSTPEQASVTVLPEIDAAEAEALADAGIDTLGALAEAESATVARAVDISPADADEWREQAVTPEAYTSEPDVAPASAATDGGTVIDDNSTGWLADDEFEVPEGEIDDWKAHARGLKIALQPFRPGGTLGHLGQPTDIDIADSNVVYLDFEANDTNTEMSLMTKVLFNSIYQRAKTTDKRVVLPIDEAWRLVKNSESLTWLEQGTRFSRHHDLSIQFITQTLDEFYEREKGKAIIDNCATKLLHSLKEVTDEQAASLDLTDREVNYITSARAGETHGEYSQALLTVEDEGKYPLRIEALPEEVPVIDGEAAETMDLSHGG
jgi:predicted flap endonuclease-1-like 5' DNA nuclease